MKVEGLLEETSDKVLMQAHLYCRIAPAHGVEQWLTFMEAKVTILFAILRLEETY